MRIGFCCVMGLMLCGSVFASEGVIPIHLEEMQKEKVLKAWSAQIERHEMMSREEILADLMRPHLPGEQTDDAFEALAHMEKDDLIALERARMQAALSSGGFIFFFVRDLIEHESRWRWNSSKGGLMPDGWNGLHIVGNMPWALFLDLVFFPFELIVAMATGSF